MRIRRKPDTLARDFLPELTNITNAMREAANDAGTLKALWVGLGGVGNLIFNGTEIKQARDELGRLQALVDATRQKVEAGKAPVPACVVATGMPVLSHSARSAAKASL